MSVSTINGTLGPARLTVVVIAAVTAAALGVQAVQARAAERSGREAGSAAVAGTVSTIAGGVGGPGPARRVSVTLCGRFVSQGGCGFSFAAGNLYVTDMGWANSTGDVVRRVNMRTGLLTTVAGDGQPGFGGDGGAASQAQISELEDASVDQRGNILVTDGISVRVVAAASGTLYGQAMTAGDIYTVAGGGSSAQNGVPATTAAIRPRGATVDHAGNLVICASRALRVVAARNGTFYGQPMTAGDIYTVAGGGTSGQDGVPATTASITPYGVAVDAAGNLLLADPGAGRLRVVAVSTGRFYGRAMTAGDIYTVAGGGTSHRDGIRATRASLVPYGLAIDRAGNLVEADFANARTRVVAARTGRFYGRAMTAGDIYTVAGGGTSLGNGVPAMSAMLKHPHAVTVDGAGNIVIGDQFANLVRVVAARNGTFYGITMRAGHLYFVAGNGKTWSSGADGLATRAQFFPTWPITFDGGNLVIADSHPTRSSLHTSIRLAPVRSGTFFGVTAKAGHLYRIAGNGQLNFSGNGTPARKSGIGQISGLAADSHGNLVISDFDNELILVVAARSGTFYGRAMKPGRIYAIAGNGNFGYSGDGGPALKAEIEPGPLRIDQHGNVIFGQNPGIRVVADRTGTFYGVPMTAGDIYTIAGGTQGTGGDGGPALDAQFELINGVARDGTDGVLVSDQYRIRMIATVNGTFFGVPMTAGDIYTVAGTGNPGTAANGTAALNADISPQSLAVDAAGNLIFYDRGVNRIMVVPVATGTYYGVAMTADHVYTIVGSGTGSLGDGGPGTQATIGFVDGLTVSSQGLAFTDGVDNRVRLILR